MNSEGLNDYCHQRRGSATERQRVCVCVANACLLARLLAHSLSCTRFFSGSEFEKSLKSVTQLSNACMFASIWELQIVQRVVVAFRCVWVSVCMSFFSLSFISCLISSHLCCVCFNIFFFISCIRFRPHLNQLKAKAKKSECVCVCCVFAEKRTRQKTWKIIIFH